ncbi:MAG: protein nirF, partial [Gammaproteobacteria bacterium]|nr:protein nirF [Gammaproteobacteria bacterium]
MNMSMRKPGWMSLALAGFLASACTTLRGTGDLGVIVERADGSLQIVEHTGRRSLATVDGLGDLSHASVVYSRDSRFAYVFGRDGGLSKVDVLKGQIVKRIVQAGN